MKKVLAVVGSRDFDDYELMKTELSKRDFDEIVSGGARGADSLARQYAEEFDIPMKEYLAEWDKFGKKAGRMRNKLVVDYAHIGIAFWDGKSPGTKHAIECFKNVNRPCKVITY